MKNFVKTVFAVLFGNIIFFGFFFLILILSIIGIAMSTDAKTPIKIPKESILNLKIVGELSEMSKNRDFRFGNADNMAIGSESIHEVIAAIQNAGKDGDIQALYIPLNLNLSLSYAQIDLIRQAIAEFKKSKKPVIAYGEMTSQKMYYLATAADKIYINPHGGLDIRGFGAQLTFFKNTLEKLEIQPQIFYAGKFKSATEPLRLDKMSEENKAQTRELLQDVSDDVLGNIAQSRKISLDSLQVVINNLETTMPNEALQSKLIDGEKYQDEVESEFKSLLKISKDDKLNYTSISDYIQDNEELSKDAKIAVYVAEGDIIDGKSDENSVGSETLVKDLEKIQKDEDIKAVVLRVNSPGGSALASAVMLREIELLRKTKPVIVSMGNLAASGGYYISTSAERVFAEPNTITGSIGVFGIIPNIKNMMQNKFGITYDEVELNDHAVLGITKNFDEREAAKMQMSIDRIYHTFKSEVSRGRKISLDSVETIAQGRVWSGEKAKAIGLVDELGTLQDAIAYTAKRIKVDKEDYFFYNSRKSDFQLYMEAMGNGSIFTIIKEKIISNLLGDYISYFNEIRNFASIQGSQMRMLFEVKI